MTKAVNYVQEGKLILDGLPLEDAKIGAAILMLTKQAEDYRAQGQYEEAKHCCDKAIALAQDPDLDKPDELDVKYAEGFVKMHLGTIYFSQGKLQQAADRYQQAQKLFSERNRPYSEGISWMALGTVYYAQARNNLENIGTSDNEWKEALKAYQRSLDIFHKLDKPVLEDRIRERLTTVNREYLQAMEKYCYKKTTREEEREKVSEEEAEVTQLALTLPSGEEVLRIPVVAKIAAGIELTLAQENITDHLIMDKETARNATFALRVKGNSMINAHILNGDYVLIHAQNAVDNGKKAAVRITEKEEEAVLKRFYKEKIDEEEYCRLEPENDQEPTIIVSLKELKPGLKERLAKKFKRPDAKVKFLVGIPAIEGEVVGVIRTFREMQSSPWNSRRTEPSAREMSLMDPALEDLKWPSAYAARASTIQKRSLPFVRDATPTSQNGKRKKRKPVA